MLRDLIQAIGTSLFKLPEEQAVYPERFNDPVALSCSWDSGYSSKNYSKMF